MSSHTGRDFQAIAPRVTFTTLPLELRQQVLDNVLLNWLSIIGFWVVYSDDASSRIGIRSYIDQLKGLSSISGKALLLTLQRFIQHIRKQSTAMRADLRQLQREQGTNIGSKSTSSYVPLPSPPPSPSSTPAPVTFAPGLRFSYFSSIYRDDRRISVHDRVMIKLNTYWSTPPSRRRGDRTLSYAARRAQLIEERGLEFGRYRRMMKDVEAITVALSQC